MNDENLNNEEVTLTEPSNEEPVVNNEPTETSDEKNGSDDPEKNEGSDEEDGKKCTENNENDDTVVEDE